MHDVLAPARRRRLARLALPLLAALGLGGVADPALAQWKWRDASGRITISDRPPPKEIPDKDILGRPAAVARATQAAALAASAPSAPSATASAAAPARAAAGKTELDVEVEARKRAAEQSAAAKARADAQRLAERRAENCGRARTQLATLESGMRIARVNAQGEREYLDDKAIASEISVARAVIASDCR